MRFCFTFLLLFWINTCIGAPSEYQHYCNLAELSVTRSEFFKASNYYDSAFLNQKGTPLAKDIYNAIQCNVYSLRQEQAFLLSFMLAKKGVGKRFFDRQIFSSLKKHEDWNTVLVQADIRKKELASISNYIMVLVHKSNQLVKETIGNLKDRRPAIENQILINELIEVTRTSGLSEDSIGCTMTNDSTLDVNPLFQRLITNQLLIYLSLKEINEEGFPFLEVLLKQNLIDPENYSAMQPYTVQNQLGMSSLIDYKNDIYLTKSGNLDLINNLRSHYGMCTIIESIQKYIYQLNNPGNGFLMSNYSINRGFPFDRTSEKYFKTNIHSYPILKTAK